MIGLPEDIDEDQSNQHYYSGCIYMCYLQVSHIIFLIIYALIILLWFHPHPLTQQKDHRSRDLECIVLCYVIGLVIEELVQVV